jgi:hypothetical protein
MVPFAGAKDIPDEPVADTDQSRALGAFWPLLNVAVQTQTWPPLPSQSLFTLKLLGLTLTFQSKSVFVQLHGTSTLFSGPVKVKEPELRQAALGTEIDTGTP